MTGWVVLLVFVLCGFFGYEVSDLIEAWADKIRADAKKTRAEAETPQCWEGTE